MANTKELSKLLAMQTTSSFDDLQEAVSDPTDYRQRIKSVVLGPDHGSFYLKGSGIETPKADFETIRKACRTEPLFRRRNNRFQNLIWKNGYTLQTQSEEAKQYVQSRMEIFAVLTGIPFDKFMRKVTRELVTFDNCLLLERRMKVSELKNIGVSIPLRGIGKQAKDGPVIAYEVIPLDTIKYRRDEHGNIIQWVQETQSGKTKTYNPNEVILIRNDEESGDILAYPTLEMVIPDVRILRQLETDASLAGHRLAFPVFMYKVGDPQYEKTLPRKDEDLNWIWNSLEGMLLEGALIIPGTDSFEVVLSDVKMDGLSSIMDYFKERVVTGTGLSLFQIGNSSDTNRSVADRLDVQLYDDVKAYQRIIEGAVNLYIYSKWLMEGGFSLGYGESGVSPNLVSMEFKEIDTDSMIKRENHAVSLWVQDGITLTELRERLGYTPLDDYSELYSSIIGNINNELALRLAKVSAGIASDSADKSTAQKTAGGANQQTNAKTRATKTSSITDDSIIESFTELLSFLDDVKESAIENECLFMAQTIWKEFETVIYSEVEKSGKEYQFIAEDMGYLKTIFQNDVIESLRSCVVTSLRGGLDSGFNEARAIDPDIAPMRVTYFNKNVESILKSLRYYSEHLIDDLFDRIEKEAQESDIPEQGVETAFLVLEYRIKQIVTSHMALAWNWGVAITAKHAGYEEIWQESELACNVCKSGWIKTDSIQLSDVPPFSTHPNCGCKVHIRSK